MTLFYGHYDTDIGFITIAEMDGEIVRLDFGKTVFSQGNNQETDLLKNAVEQLREYLSGKRKHFDLPVKLLGTDFQLKVWDALVKIPYGETRSYKEVAEMTGSPKAYRAVGNANNKNPVAIIYP